MVLFFKKKGGSEQQYIEWVYPFNKRPDCFWTEIKTVDEEEVHRKIGGYLPVLAAQPTAFAQNEGVTPRTKARAVTATT
ncbi:hypothetical protein DT065_14570 [Salicibibacter kimchii]|uniref:Uncharacterized protein n=1 Tax=Salicibibacter kimchii TaxID=2099786 RepID=A0A345C1L9_9BACI|nr:hypothetical protein DT065_14570 [Salicibibacter kimchii]